jgi:hypothetical protein
MSIYNRRVDELLEEITKWALVEGRVPTPVESTRKLKELLEGVDPSLPRMQLRVQPSRTRFDRAGFNSSVEEAVADLSLLYAEGVDTLTRVINGLNQDDINHRALAYQLSIIDDILESLLLAEPGASGYFFSVFDSFNDLAKVDQEDTTAEVDLGGGVVRLPIAGGVKKLDLGFLQNRVRANLRIHSQSQLLGSRLIQGSKFGHLFNDIIGDVWGVEVESGIDDVEIEFTIPIASALDRGIAQTPKVLATVETISAIISRVEIEPMSVTPMAVDVLFSLDGSNFVRLPGINQSIELADKKVSLTFEETRVKFLRFKMRKAADRVETPASAIAQTVYRYVFGLKSIALYNSGFGTYGELISQLLEPDGPDDLILSRVALDVDERVPEGSNINYFVGLGETGDWLPITPGSRDQEDNRVVEFGTSRLSSRFDNQQRVTATPSINSSRNGITFYDLYNTGADIIPRTTRLFRGIKSWRRKVNLREDLLSIQNNYVVFTLTDNEQKLYLEVEDEKVTGVAWDGGSNPTSIPVNHNIFRDESVPVKPIGGTPQENPSYSIRSLIRLYNSSVGGSGGDGATIAALPSLHQAQLTLPLSIAAGKIAVDQYIYLEPGGLANGYYKVLTVQETSDALVKVEDPGKLLYDASNITWSIGYQDITDEITDAEQNRIVVASSQEILATDELIVTYRRPLGPEHRLITSSVVVKENTEGQGQIFEAGRDYVVKPDNKSVARIPEGRLLAQGDQTTVRVDFDYAVEEPDLDTYVCFFMVDSAEPKVVELASQLTIDDEAGEALFIEDGAQVYEVSDKLIWPALPRGWRQITVKSKPILDASGVIDTDTLMYRVLILLDAAGRLIFNPNGVYFTRMTAFPQSMRETNLFKLQVGVRVEDREWYALDSGKIVINWDPTEVPDTIYPVVTLGPPSASISPIEEFELEYRLRADVPPERQVRLRAVFERGSKTSPSVTPELRSYNLKFSY